MMFRRNTKVATALAAVALVAAACGSDSSDAEALKLGYLLPETGQLAFLGPR